MRRIAAGGFGMVFLAHQKNLDRQVAIKLLLAETLRESEAVARFNQEARITAAICHPGIIQVLDHGAESGVPWIAYEYVQGRSLREIIDSGGLAFEQAVLVVSQVAEALNAAHSKGVLHRDIKPDNILEVEPHRFKVADFGIATWPSESAVQTKTGVILGTPDYLSPEQVTGGAASPASDLYALGVMLFELVTGKLPFAGDSPMTVLENHLTCPIPSATALRPELPVAIDLVLVKALAKRPEDRHASCSKFRDDLARLIGKPGRAVPSPGSTRSATLVRTKVAVARAAPPPSMVTANVVAPKRSRWRSRGALAAAAALLVIAVSMGIRPVRDTGDIHSPHTPVPSRPSRAATLAAPEEDSEQTLHRWEVDVEREIYRPFRLSEIVALEAESATGPRRTQLAKRVRDLCVQALERYRDRLRMTVRDHPGHGAIMFKLAGCAGHARTFCRMALEKATAAERSLLQETVVRWQQDVDSLTGTGYSAVLKASLRPLVNSLMSVDKRQSADLKAQDYLEAADSLTRIIKQRNWIKGAEAAWLVALLWQAQIELDRVDLEVIAHSDLASRRLMTGRVREQLFGKVVPWIHELTPEERSHYLELCVPEELLEFCSSLITNSKPSEADRRKAFDASILVALDLPDSYLRKPKASYRIAVALDHLQNSEARYGFRLDARVPIRLRQVQGGPHHLERLARLGQLEQDAGKSLGQRDDAGAIRCGWEWLRLCELMPIASPPRSLPAPLLSRLTDVWAHDVIGLEAICSEAEHQAKSDAGAFFGVGPPRKGRDRLRDQVLWLKRTARESFLKVSNGCRKGIYRLRQLAPHVYRSGRPNLIQSIAATSAHLDDLCVALADTESRQDVSDALEPPDCPQVPWVAHRHRAFQCERDELGADWLKASLDASRAFGDAPRQGDGDRISRWHSWLMLNDAVIKAYRDTGQDSLACAHAQMVRRQLVDQDVIDSDLLRPWGVWLLTFREKTCHEKDPLLPRLIAITAKQKRSSGPTGLQPPSRGRVGGPPEPPAILKPGAMPPDPGRPPAEGSSP